MPPQRISLGIKNIVSTNIYSNNITFLNRLIRSSIKDSIIPSCTINKGSSDWEVRFSKGAFDVAYHPNQRRINYSNDSEDVAEWDVLFLVRQTLERQLQEKGFLSLHSSSLELNDKGVLIFGASDSGKTSLVIESSRHGFGYISNDWTIIDGSRTEYALVAGTQPIISKRTVIETFFPDIDAPSSSPAPHLRVYAPSDLFERKEIACDLDLLIIPKIKTQFSVSNARRNVTKNSFFESSSLYITGNYLMNDVSDASAPNLDTIECRQKRAKIINHLVDNYKPVIVEGTPKDILTYIKRTLV